MHYNSPKPAEVGAHAYTEGLEVYIAPGQEEHLAHELWHVIQQLQGRVKATGMVEGNPLNEQPTLELEATQKGNQAKNGQTGTETPINQTAQLPTVTPVQRTLVYDQDAIEEDMKHSPSHFEALGFVTATSANGKRVWVRAKDKDAVLDLDAPQETLEAGNLAHESSPKAVGNVKNYLKAQADYQNYLNQTKTESEIMKTHKSVGFEYEFANYTNGNADSEELSSHIVLGASGDFSSLFPIPFELETDSGKVLEVGMPPLLVSNKPEDGNPDKAGIKAVYEKMRGTMRTIREATQGRNMSALIDYIQEIGLGESWVKNKVIDEHTDLIISDRQGLAEKFKNSEDGIYSQMNISMNAEESAAAIELMMEDDEALIAAEKNETRGSAEKGVLGRVAKELNKLLNPLATNKAGQIAVVHIAKAMANILAIPALKAKREAIEIAAPYELDSIVKELYGIWVKDSLQNILSTSIVMKNPAIFIQATNAAKQYMEGEIETAYQSLLTVNKAPRTLELLRKIDKAREYIETEQIKKRNRDTGYQTIFDTYDLKQVFAGDKSSFLADLGAQVTIMRQELAKDKDESGEVDWEAIFYPAELEAVKLVSNKLTEEETAHQEKPLKIKTLMLEELTQTLNHVEKSAKVQPPVSEFGSEDFGTGTGVRKDTFVTSKGGVNVAEFRSAYVIKKYLEEEQD